MTNLIPIAKRLVIAIATVFLASLLVFLAMQALPGDVAQQLLGQDATDEAIETMRAQLGLDTPVWLRFFEWLGGAVTGDLGTSLVSGEAVAPALGVAFRNTLLIAVPTMVIGVVLSLGLGMMSGVRRGRVTDSVISITSLIVMSIPEFMIATILVLLLAITIPVFPAVVLLGDEATLGELLPSVWLPVISLTLVMSAYILRTMRSSTIDVMASEFVTTAQLKGLTSPRIIWKHAIPSALLPVLNVIALNVAWLLGGVVVVETIFNYPGMGKMMIEAVHNRDLPVIQAIALVSATVYVVCNLAADLSALALDPKLRTRRKVRS